MNTLSVRVAGWSQLLPLKPTKKALREALRNPEALTNGEWRDIDGRTGTIREYVDHGVEGLEVLDRDSLVAFVAIGRGLDGNLVAVVR